MEYTSTEKGHTMSKKKDNCKDTLNERWKKYNTKWCRYNMGELRDMTNTRLAELMMECKCVCIPYPSESHSYSAFRIDKPLEEKPLCRQSWREGAIAAIYLHHFGYEVIVRNASDFIERTEGLYFDTRGGYHVEMSNVHQTKNEAAYAFLCIIDNMIEETE